MCLSVAYEMRGQQKVKLLEHVSAIDISPGKVCLSDIMGEQLTVEGCIGGIDLMKNEIIILPAK